MCKLIIEVGTDCWVSCPQATPEQIALVRHWLLDKNSKHAPRLKNTTLVCLKMLGYSLLSNPAEVVEYWLLEFLVNRLEGIVNGYKPEEGPLLGCVVKSLRGFLRAYPKIVSDRTSVHTVPLPTRRTRSGEQIEAEIEDPTPGALGILEVIEELQERDRKRKKEEQEKVIAQQRLQEEFCRHANVLKEPERTAYFLHKVNDPPLSYEATREQLSKRLGRPVSIGSVKGWINRAQNKLAGSRRTEHPGNTRGPDEDRFNRQRSGPQEAGSSSDSPATEETPAKGETERRAAGEGSWAGQSPVERRKPGTKTRANSKVQGVSAPGLMGNPE